MGGSVISGLCVILVLVLVTEYDVSASPIPFPDICYYLRGHRHYHSGHKDETTTPPPATPEQKAEEEKKQKYEQLKKLIAEFLEWYNPVEAKPVEEKKEPEPPKEEPKGFASFGDFFNDYVAMFTKLYHSV